MQTPGLAARRFFGAFYRWTRLTWASREPGSHPPLRRKLHHHPRGKEQSEYFTAFDELYRSAGTQSRPKKTETKDATTIISKKAGGVRPRPGPAVAKNAARRSSHPARQRALLSPRPGRQRPRNPPLPARYTGEALDELYLFDYKPDRSYPLYAMRVRSEEDVPPHKIPPLRCVLRSRSTDIMELDCAVPTSLAFDFMLHLCDEPPPHDSIQADCRAEFHTLDSAANSHQAGTALQVIRVSGHPVDLSRALSRVGTAYYLLTLPVNDSQTLPSANLDLRDWTVRRRSMSQISVESLITELAWSRASDEAKALLHSVAAKSGTDLHIRDPIVCSGGVRSLDNRSCHPVALSGSPGAIIWAGAQIRALKLMLETNKKLYSPQHQDSDIRLEEPVPDNISLSEQVRIASRLLTQPVVLVTTSGDPHPLNPYKNCRGVTVSSFNTVTLEPKPIISFNLKLPSRSWNIMALKQHPIRIHVLDATPQGAAIANAFTRPHTRGDEPFHHLLEQGVSVEPRPQDGAPSITQSGGVLALLRADIGKCTGVGDHMIVTAEVSHCEFLYNEKQRNVAGLSYAARGYRARGMNVPIAFSSVKGGVEGVLQIPSKGEDISRQTSTDGAASSRNSRGVPRPTPSALAALQHRAPAMAGMTGGQTREYSTTPSLRQGSKNKSGPTNRDLVEPGARRTTVADFFNVPDDDRERWRFHHVKKLVETKKLAEATARRLELGYNKLGDPLTPSQVQKLQDRLRATGGMVDRELSKSAARSLRLMLDRGRVDFKRAQWLESSIERGQAVLANDIQEIEVKSKLELMDEATFHRVKQKLEADHDALVTETMRLRQVVDEEGDGPVFDPEEETERGR